MTLVKFAIIGCGRIAERHAEHINNFGLLVAVCDIIPSKADTIAQKYGAKASYTIEEFIASKMDIDVVAICSPNGLHAFHAIMCLNAGYHVLCEKPMALSVQDCEQMILASEQNEKKLFAIKQNRFNPPVVAVKKVMEEGQLGKIFNIQLNCFWNRNADYYSNSWKGTKDLDGGTLFTQFSHFIDLIYWMIGDVKEVAAFATNYAHQGQIEFEDTGVVILSFENGAIGTINYTVNSYAKNMEGSLTIFGENGTVKIGGQYLNKLEYQCIKNYKIEDIPKGNRPNDYGTYVGSMSNHDKVYENVVAVLKNNEPMATSAFEGLKTVSIIEKIYQSITVQ